MKLLSLLLSLILLCSCQRTTQMVSYDEAASYTRALWNAANVQDGAVFAQDLNLDGCPELYLLYLCGEYDGVLQGIALNEQTANLGSIKMGKPADDVWWVAHTYNEEKAYLTIDSKGYACSGDGNTCHTQHNIVLTEDGLSSFNVLVNNVPGSETTYSIDGKLITDREEYNKAMEDFRLKDGQSDSLDLVLFTDETLEQAVSDVLTQWETEHTK